MDDDSKAVFIVVVGFAIFVFLAFVLALVSKRMDYEILRDCLNTGRPTSECAEMIK